MPKPYEMITPVDLGNIWKYLWKSKFINTKSLYYVIDTPSKRKRLFGVPLQLKEDNSVKITMMLVKMTVCWSTWVKLQITY